MKVFSLQAPVYRGARLASCLTAKTSPIAASGETPSLTLIGAAATGSRPSRRPQWWGLGRIDIHCIQIVAAARWVKARKCRARRS
jgi:hypothetical protein